MIKVSVLRGSSVGRLDAVLVGQLDQRPIQQDEVIRDRGGSPGRGGSRGLLVRRDRPAAGELTASRLAGLGLSRGTAPDASAFRKVLGRLDADAAGQLAGAYLRTRTRRPAGGG
jgi:hypothetical protein